MRYFFSSRGQRITERDSEEERLEMQTLWSSKGSLNLTEGGGKGGRGGGNGFGLGVEATSLLRRIEANGWFI